MTTVEFEVQAPLLQMTSTGKILVEIGKKYDVLVEFRVKIMTRTLYFTATGEKENVQRFQNRLLNLS